MGNKGQKYERTRHNLAWMMLEKLSYYDHLVWNTKFKAEYAQHHGNEQLIILKPQTLMNNSGQSVSAAMSFYKIETDSLLVIHDDLELPFGTVQFKKGGGAGGHNGLRSITNLCGSPEFFRLRMGISRPPAGRDVSSWVLSRFSPEDEAVLDDYCRLAAGIFETAADGGIIPGPKIKLL
ncbi:MAG: aminoacyl-tRNA hydrolase [Spirochaetales bacterium]|nr:aminoacyl-tRNA hydrolase [Spirochaetales bacterium]